MNYIERLTRERNETRELLGQSLDMVDDLIAYLSTAKFAWPDNDYVHVQTDLMPKLRSIQRKMRA